MLIIFNFNQSKNNSIYLYDIINLIWYYLTHLSISTFEASLSFFEFYRLIFQKIIFPLSGL